MGVRGTSVRIILGSILARRSGMPPANEQADISDGQVGLLMANLPGSRNR